MSRPKGALTGKMQKAADLAAQGKSYQEIGDELGVDRTTVGRWFAREDMKTLRSAALAEVIRGMIPRAYATLQAQLNSSNPWVAQGAARELIRLYTQMEGTADASVVVSFANMPMPGTPQGAGELPGSDDAIETEYA